MTNRQEIIDFARTLLGVPFHHQGRHARLGVDCVGLLVLTAQHFGLTMHDLKGYSRQPDGVTLERELSSCLEATTMAEAQPGDVVTFWMRSRDRIQHAAILTDRGMVHTWAIARRVVEHGINFEWQSQMAHFYRFPGLDPTPYPKPIPWPVVDPALLAQVERQTPAEGCCG